MQSSLVQFETRLESLYSQLHLSTSESTSYDIIQEIEKLLEEYFSVSQDYIEYVYQANIDLLDQLNDEATRKLEDMKKRFA